MSTPTSKRLKFVQLRNNHTGSAICWWPAQVFADFAELQNHISPRGAVIQGRVLLETVFRKNDGKIALLVGECKDHQRRRLVQVIDDERDVDDYYLNYFTFAKQAFQSSDMESLFKTALAQATSLLQADIGTEERPAENRARPVNTHHASRSRHEAIGGESESEISFPRASLVKQAPRMTSHSPHPVPSIINTLRSQPVTVSSKKGNKRTHHEANLPKQNKVKDVLDEEISSRDNWQTVFKKLKRKGLKTSASSGLETSWYYIPPGGRKPTKLNRAKKGVDYFIDEEGVKKWALETYGWCEDAMSSSQSSQSSSSDETSQYVNGEKKDSPVYSIANSVVMDVEMAPFIDRADSGISVSSEKSEFGRDFEDQSNLVKDGFLLTQPDQEEEEDPMQDGSDESMTSSIADSIQDSIIITKVKKAPVKKATVKKVSVKKVSVKKASVKKAPVKKAPIKKVPIKKAVAPATRIILKEMKHAPPSPGSVSSGSQSSASTVELPTQIISNYTVIKTLTKLGIKSSIDGTYTVPGPTPVDLSTLQTVREHLCRNGIVLPNDKIADDILTGEEQEDMANWILFTFVPLKDPTEIPVMDLLSFNKGAWPLLQKIGFRWRSGSYLFPEVDIKNKEDGKNSFPSIEDMQAQICRVGLPECGTDLVSQEERIGIGHWAANHRNFNIFKHIGRTRVRRSLPKDHGRPPMRKPNTAAKQQTSKQPTPRQQAPKQQAPKQLAPKQLAPKQPTCKPTGNDNGTAVTVTPPGSDDGKFAKKRKLPKTMAPIRPKIVCVHPLTPAGKDAIELMKHIKGTPVQREDPWVNAWEKMKYTGWTYKFGMGLHDYIYLPPGASGKGIEGRDFFATEHDVKLFAYNHLGWAGDETFWKDVTKNQNAALGEKRVSRRPRESISFIHPVATNKTLRGNDRKIPHVKKKEDKMPATKAPDNESAVIDVLTQGPSEEPIEQPSQDLLEQPSEEPIEQPLEPQSIQPTQPILTVQQHLNNCLEQLHPSYNFCDKGTENNKLSVHMNEVLQFLRPIVETWGENAGFIDMGIGGVASSSLYLCGGPGTGKTTTIQECCKEIQAYAETNKESILLNKNNRWDPNPYISYINASSLKSSATSSTDLIAKLAKGLDLPEDTSRTVFENRLDSTSSFKKRLVILVLDELDLILTGNTGTDKLIQMLFEWASNPHYLFAFVGVSNSVDNKFARHLSSLCAAASGNKTYKTLVFSTYDQEELIDIIHGRVGTSIIAKPAIELACRKVAATSGDARRVLELTSNSVTKCMESLSDEDRAEPLTDLRAIVSVRHMMKAVKEGEGLKYTELISGLSTVAKVVLCVAVTVGHVNGPNKPLQQGFLRQLCMNAAKKGIMDTVTIHEFMDILEQLVNSGLLMTGDNTLADEVCPQIFPGTSLKLGVQLDDVECALETVFEEDAFYSGLMAYVRKLG